MRFGETLDQSWSYGTAVGAGGVPVPGLLMLFSGAEATLLPIPLKAGARVLGRGDIEGVPLDDACMSRKHAQLRFADGHWHLQDLGSRNGTFLDGAAVRDEVVSRDGRVLRIGDTLFVLTSDLRVFLAAVVARGAGTLAQEAGRSNPAAEDVVLGPTLRECWNQIEQAAQAGDTLHLTGESGSGKELAARHFHRSGPRAAGPFVAVNCATIPSSLAERLLFGAKKGAYSGADQDVSGYVQAADGGTLFLDEVAELDAAVQAKLLRVMESREVLPLGAAKARKVDVGVCSATHQDLRAQVAARRFREDLFFRIGRPAVALPPLRDRVEDIPWIIQRELRKAGAPAMHVSLVESCLLRPWPGNVRELIVEIRGAAAEAARSASARVEASHLSSDAGRGMEDAQSPLDQVVAQGVAKSLDPAAILDVLRREGGNVTRASRLLGWHRTQLRRWLARHNVDAKQLGTPLVDDTPDEA